MLTSFWTNNSFNSATGCWNWTGGKNTEGYGYKRHLGRMERVSRLSAHLYLGLDLRSPLQVLHHCDNPSCFNPKHLFIGGASDNQKDAVRKGRHKEIKKTHCINGHPYSGDNLLIYNKKFGPSRQCKICRDSSWEKYKRKLGGANG